MDQIKLIKMKLREEKKMTSQCDEYTLHDKNR